MFDDLNIVWETLANDKCLRQWVVSEVRYDFEDDCYGVIHFGPDEQVSFGSPFPAYNHAKNLYNYYRKQYPDVRIVIEEVAV